MRRCGFCETPLDRPMFPLTKDCGGDCLGCMAFVVEDPHCAEHLIWLDESRIIVLSSKDRAELDSLLAVEP